MDFERTLTALNLSGANIVISSKNHIVFQNSQGDHLHPVPEFHVFLAGTGRLIAAGETIPLRRGDCVLIGPNTTHRFEIGEKAPANRLEALLHIDRHTALPEGFAWLGQEKTVRKWKLREPFFSIAQLIANELQNKGYKYETVISNCFDLLFTHLARMSGSTSRVPAEANARWDKTAKDRYTRESIDNYLLLNYGSDITIEDLAAHLHVSARHAHRLVQQHTGQSFKQYLLYIRMTNARHLLKTTNLPVYQIAEKVGYQYSGNFCKAFRQYVLQTPREYRKQFLP